MMHFVSFSADVPCCVALLCSPVSTERKKLEGRRRMYEEVSASGKVDLYIERMPSSPGKKKEEGGKHPVKAERGWEKWNSAEVSLRDDIPPELWRDNLRLLHFDEKGVLRSVSGDASEDDLELAFALEGADDCLLYMSWRPAPEVAALVFSYRSVDAVAGEIGDSFKGKSVLFLCLPRIAFSPNNKNRLLSAEPKDDISNLWGMLSSREWFFRAREVAFEVSRKKLDAGTDGFSLSLDFGTSSSTAALVKHHQGQDELGAHIFEGLASWRHNTVVPDYSRNKTDREIVWDAERWENENSRISRKFAVVPEIVRRSRWPLEKSSGGIVPSLLYRLRDASPLDSTYVIGDEAEAALMDAGKATGEHAQVRLDGFVFSPKSLVSSKTAGMSADTGLQEGVHVTAYLRSLFDMVAVRLASPSCPAEETTGYLKKVSCSFPVSWLYGQRQFFESCLQHALESSFLRWFLAKGGAKEALAGGISLDEASASFMGFLSRRFGNMDPKEILELLGPFDYRERRPEGRNVLVIDFGEGTTDVVWLHLAPSEGSGARVVSKVKRHFALNQGGLEVTRQIAQTLKTIAFEFNVARGMDRVAAKRWLRTNLKEDGIEERFLDGQKKKVAQFRREKATLYFERSEVIKKGLSSRDEVDIDWKSLLAETQLATPDESVFTASRLVTIVGRIFKPIFSRVRLWTEEEGRLDVVLVSGRASALRGLREELEKSIPPQMAPLKNDFIWPAEYSFEKTEDNAERDAKTVVVAGLAHNVYRQIGFTRDFIECEPLDELKRSRSIGILEADELNRWLPGFRTDMELLVRSDFSRINPGEELPIPIVETNYMSEGAGLYLGINFAGKKGSDGIDVDRPQPFARIVLNNRNRKVYKDLQIFLKQLSATELCLSRAVIEMPDGSIEETDNSFPEEKPLYKLNICDVDIVMKPFFDTDDMRNSGKIHLEGGEPIDRDD